MWTPFFVLILLSTIVLNDNTYITNVLCMYVNHIILAVTTMASVLTTSKSTVITPTVSSTSVLETTTIPTVSSVEGKDMHMDSCVKFKAKNAHYIWLQFQSAHAVLFKHDNCSLVHSYVTTYVSVYICSYNLKYTYVIHTYNEDEEQ